MLLVCFQALKNDIRRVGRQRQTRPITRLDCRRFDLIRRCPLPAFAITLNHLQPKLSLFGCKGKKKIFSLQFFFQFFLKFLEFVSVTSFDAFLVLVSSWWHFY